MAKANSTRSKNPATRKPNIEELERNLTQVLSILEGLAIDADDDGAAMAVIRAAAAHARNRLTSSLETVDEMMATEVAHA